MNTLRKIRRQMRAMVRCPICGRRIRFNWWWIVDVDTYFYCKHCGIRLAQLGWMMPAALMSIAIAHIFNRYQTLSAAHGDMTDFLWDNAVFYFALILFIRVALLFVLFLLKFAKRHRTENTEQETSSPADENLWWEPFSDG
jgi:ribosomal protein L37AE/L43A